MSPLAKTFVHDLTKNVFCRLATSPIHGIGVFAIRDIPKKIDPMQEHREVEFIEVPVEEVKNNPDISDAVKKLVVDMCPEEDGVYFAPPFSLNEIGIAWYLNHSDTPNMEEKDGYFFTKREIKAGEELTVDYGTYGKLNL